MGMQGFGEEWRINSFRDFVRASIDVMNDDV